MSEEELPAIEIEGRRYLVRLTLDWRASEPLQRATLSDLIALVGKLSDEQARQVFGARWERIVDTYEAMVDARAEALEKEHDRVLELERSLAATLTAEEYERSRKELYEQACRFERERDYLRRVLDSLHVIIPEMLAANAWAPSRVAGLALMQRAEQIARERATPPAAPGKE